MKSLLVMLSVLALGSAASLKAFELTNTQVMDDQGNFILRWGFIPGTGDIEMEFQGNCTGWLGIGITNPDGSTIDNIMGGYDDITGQGYLIDRFMNVSEPIPGGISDDSQDIVLKGAVYHEPWTIIRISRSIFTGDAQDVAIVAGPMSIEWTYAESDDMDIPHAEDARGVTAVIFTPTTD